MLTLALVLAIGAGALHVVIFALESILWMTPRARQTFGIETDAQAEATRPLAFNQGFYNLFLAVGAVLGAGIVVAGAAKVGWTLVVFACARMLAASLVLVTTGRTYRGAALRQGTLPALALLAAAIGALGA